MAEVDYDALSEEQLQEMVIDSKCGEAATINNEGKEAQIAYLKATNPEAIDRRNRVAGCLAVCQALQEKLWDACTELEGELGGNPDTISLSTEDLRQYDVDTLIETWDAANTEEEKDEEEPEEEEVK